MRVAVPDATLRDAIRQGGHPDGAALDRAALDGVEFVLWDGTGPAPAVDVWVTPSGTTHEAVARAREVDGLRVVQLQSAGYDGLPGVVPPGVLLCNAAGVHDDATAELALGLLLASLRGIPEAVRSHGHWQAMPGRRSLADSRVLILGYGSIGRALAERLLACRAVVTAVASRPRRDALAGEVYAADALPELLPTQDALVVLLPLSDATRGFVGADLLARLPDDALVVNVARGPVADTDAILAEAGRLRFALDVTDPEPLPDGHPLWAAPDVLITPHMAGGTTAMLPRMAALARAQIERLLAGRPPAHVVAGSADG